jgi:hypothetical protein
MLLQSWEALKSQQTPLQGGASSFLKKLEQKGEGPRPQGELQNLYWISLTRLNQIKRRWQKWDERELDRPIVREQLKVWDQANFSSCHLGQAWLDLH